MQFNTFFIPVSDSGHAQEELNTFLRSKRVLAVEKVFTGQGWAFCVEWLEGGKPELSGKPRVDYKEVLSPDEFTLFSKLREKRRELARRDGVQVYTIMTNEQLAGMVRLKVNDIAGLRTIDGVGESRIEKYGSDFLPLMEASG